VYQLGVNYRSGQEVIEVFTTFSGTMKASRGALPLQLVANRGILNARPEFRVVKSTNDEISAVAAAIQEQHGEGVPFRRQALLCASNARLSEIAEGLEARGIPVLHLGSLFERPEIKDLLALLSMLSDPYVAGLVRAATMSSYEMPLQEVMRLIGYLKESNAGPLDWRQVGAKLPNLTTESLAGLTRVANLFADLNPTGNPWTILVTWVIDRLGMAKALYLAKDPQSRMKGLALWQFLNFCRRQPAGIGIPSVRLLDRVRRLLVLSEDRGLRQMPGAAEGIDAVRLMTIHASKGLEFDIVHIPGMVTSGLPRNNTAPRCIPPDGLIHGFQGLTGLEAVKAGHDEEEECLFFVALSRARDRLFLYASSVQSDGKVRNPSKFISAINHLLVRPANPSQHCGVMTPATPMKIIWEEKPVWTESQINLFERCPRRFLYTHVLKLGGRRTETAFMKMHNVVSEVFEWLKTAHETTTPSKAELDVLFESAWQAKGAVDHGYADDYRRIARRLVDYLIEARSTDIRSPVVPLSLGWAEGDISVTPDSVARGDQGQVVVGRVKTGKPRSNAFDDIEYTILHLAAVQAYGGQALVEVTFLTSETAIPMSISEKKLVMRRQKVQNIVQSVRSGDFPIKAEARTCPRCPSFFICGDLPGGAVTVKKL